VPVLRVMAVFTLIGSIGVNVGDIYKAIGRPGILAKLSLVELAMMLPALLYGARFGLVGVAWAHAAVASVDVVLRLVVAKVVVRFRAADVLRQLAPSVAAGSVLAFVAAATLAATSGLGEVTSLFLTTLVGAAAYIAALWRMDGHLVRRILGWVGLSRGVAA
jgi:PST family polysaccharide transporter